MQHCDDPPHMLLLASARVERGTEVISATAAVNVTQTRDLRRKLRFVLFNQKLLQFLREPRKHAGKQRWLRLMIGRFSSFPALEGRWFS